MSGDCTWGAILMTERADRWYWAEREICGFATDTEPPCVKSPGHDGDHDGTYAASPMERLTAWLDAGGPLPDGEPRP